MIADMQNPPSDNLYKFVAISTIVLTAFLIGFFYIEMQGVQKSITADWELFREQSLRLEMWSLEPIDEPVRALRKEYAEKRIASDTKTYQERFKRSSDSLLHAGQRMLATAVVFGILCVMGLVLWYKAFQQHQDQRNRLEIALLDIQRKREELELQLRIAELSSRTNPSPIE